MAELILHHYPESLFSEKVRALFNAKELAWRSVIIPMIMPRPDTIPLTGGYRRTPVLQVGADVYCDTALICAYVDDLGAGATLYPAATRLAANTLARWVDTELFWAAVTLRFQPSNTGSFFPNAEAAAAFAADRANFSQGSTVRQLPLHEAAPRYRVFMAELEAQLSDGRAYLFGSAWTIADFATYHLLWFIHAGGAMGDVLAAHKATSAWFQRMLKFGAKKGQDMSGEDALAVARAATPAPVDAVNDLPDIALGDLVDVGPTDYGVMPSRGQLMKCDDHSIVIRREHERTGVVHVHFPRQRFGVTRSS